MSKLLLSLSLIAASTLCTVASAAPVAISSVTASGTFFTYNVANLINGVGLNGDNTHTGNWQAKWMNDGGATGSLTFDFGSTVALASTIIWNYGGGCCDSNRSVKDLVIEASTDGLNYLDLGQFVLDQSDTTAIDAQVLSLGSVNARFVRFGLLSNYGGGYAGLSEVQFFADSGSNSSVPEPTALSLLAAAGLGMAAARRRKAA